MSLINQMLKDLEKRSGVGNPSATRLSPNVTSVSAPRRNGKAVWGVVSLLAVVACVVWFVVSGGRREVVSGTDEPVMDLAPALPKRASAVSAMVPPVEEKPAPIAADKLPATLEMVRFEQNAERLLVKIDFSKMPAYGLTRGEQGRQLVLDLPAGVMAASLPNTAELPLLRSVAYQGRDTGMQLIFTFTKGCRYEDLLLTEKPTGVGQILSFVVQPEPLVHHPVALQSAPDIATPPAAVAAASVATVVNDMRPAAAAGAESESGITRQEVHLTPRERAANYFLEVGTALKQGRHREAETILRAALALDPKLVDARDQLLRLLAQQDRRADIRSLLVEGIQAAPDYLPYRVRFARILIEDGALDQARGLLTRAPCPPVVEAPELHAMLATVYQRQGQYAEAAQTYRALLAIKPEHAVWWMGLGIALEGATLEDQAQQAYRQAISRGGLSSGLQTYIRQRLMVLGGRGTQLPAHATNAGKEQS